MNTFSTCTLKSTITFSLLTIVLGLLSCSKDDATKTPEMTNEIDISLYIGNYEMTVSHITGIHPHHDSIGNFLYFGIDTVDMTTMNLEISQVNQSDSLLIKGLITDEYDLFCCNLDVLSIIENDSIKLIREEGDATGTDYVRGYITIDSDSIRTSYKWDHSDTWSTDALPQYGLVEGSGVR